MPEYQSVVTIQVYVVDQQGRNVFSFVLNSHHKIFAEARKASAPLKAAAGVLLEFNALLASVTRDDGISPGFTTFSDEQSQIEVFELLVVVKAPSVTKKRSRGGSADVLLIVFLLFIVQMRKRRGHRRQP